MRTEICKYCPYVFHQNGALGTSPIAMSEGRDKAARIDFQKRLRLLVWVHFDILVIDTFHL